MLSNNIFAAEKKEKGAKPQLLTLVNELNKKFGDNAVILGGVKSEQEEVEGKISTGNVSLDIALGGGLPLGRMIHISGGQSSMKSTLACHIIREAQKQGLVCSFHDAEGTTTEDYLQQLGVDVSTLIYSRPYGLEECTQMILDLQKGGIVNLAVYDSLEATPPLKEYESQMDDTQRLGVKQQLIGLFFRKFQAGNNRLVREGKKPFTLIVLNQLREKIGAYGDPEYAPGGRSKDFVASIDLRLRRGDWLAEGTGENKEIVGQVIKFKIEKSKVYKRMQTGEFDFYFAENRVGVPIGWTDNALSIIYEAVQWGLIEKKGAWFVLPETEEKFQGQEALATHLRTKPEVIEQYKEKILQLSLK